MSKCSYPFEIWQAPQQHHRRDTCQSSEQLENSNMHRSRSHLRDFFARSYDKMFYAILNPPPPTIPKFPHASARELLHFFTNWTGLEWNLLPASVSESTSSVQYVARRSSTNYSPRSIQIQNQHMYTVPNCYHMHLQILSTPLLSGTGLHWRELNIGSVVWGFCF